MEPTDPEKQVRIWLNMEPAVIAKQVGDWVTAWYAHITAQEEKEKLKKRGDHVINNGVLKIYYNIVKKLGKDPNSGPFRNDTQNPLGNMNIHRKIQDEFKVSSSSSSSADGEGVDHNASFFGKTVEMLVVASAEYVKTKNYYDEKAKLSALIRALVQEMKSFRGTRIPIFIDKKTKESWLNKNSRRSSELEEAIISVNRMLDNVLGKLSIWSQS